MANLNELKQKVKMYTDFMKIIQIDKIKVSQRIAELKQQIYGASVLVESIKDLKDIISSNKDVFEPYTSAGAKLFPNKDRTVYFFLETKDNSAVGQYSDKKIYEYIENNVKLGDVIYIIGERLHQHVEGEMIKSKQDLDDLHLIIDNNGEFHEISTVIAEASLAMYESLFSHNIKVVYDDIKNPANLFEHNVFPFDESAETVSIDERDVAGMYFEDIKAVVKDLKKGRVDYGVDITNVKDAILKSFIISSLQFVITKYMLNLSTRELQTLEDRDKNIEESIVETNLIAQKIRQESITRELLTNSTAFKSLQATRAADKMKQSGSRQDEIIRKKKEDEDE